ncbi:hypothetical protein [Fischerella sp. PCC 9605]|uniref:hypothetical protein n=1 Tax=Fischerella sp. PCC 9605 TaxID=1173024 RepID=UPI00047C5EED|nr:hypothetical protein [Fischerella sp. PCC 9605]
MVVPGVATTVLWLIFFAFVITTFIFGVRIHMNRQQQQTDKNQLQTQQQQPQQTETPEERQTRIELIKQRGWQ